jgi:PASTA domain
MPRRGLWLIPVLLILAALVVTGCGDSNGSTVREIVVPGVTGKPVAEARAAITGAGLNALVQKGPSEELAGTVVHQEPSAGSKVPENRSVTLYVSSGQTKIKGPPSAETTPAQPTLTGIGTTDADWEANHEPDPEFAPGSAYDPDPSLVPPGGDPAFSSRYYGVLHSGGRIESYEMRFAPGTSISEAKSDTLAEFPDDAKVDWFHTVPATKLAGACAQMQVSSATLVSALGRGPTAGLVEFSSGEAADTYDPESVSSAILFLQSPKPASKALGC